MRFDKVTFYHALVERPCLSCVLKFLITFGMICGFTPKLKCVHDERVMCTFRPSLLSVFLSMLTGFFLSVGAIYEFWISFNANIRFWELENLEAIAYFSFAFGYGLTLMLLARKYEELNRVLVEGQNLVTELVAATSANEVMERFPWIRLQGDFCTIFSMSTSIIFAIFKSCSRFAIVNFFRTYTFMHLTLGMILVINLLLIGLNIHHTKLKATLNRMIANRSLHLGDTFSLKKDLDLSISLQFSCYRMLETVNNFLSFNFIIYFVSVMLTLNLGLFITLIRVIKWDLFDTTQSTSPFLFMMLLFAFVLFYICYLGNVLVTKVRKFLYSDSLAEAN